MQNGCLLGLRKHDLYLDSYPHYYEPEGTIQGSTFIREIQEDDNYLNGIILMDHLLDRLVDENIETIVLTRNGHRYMSTLEDWQEYGKSGPTYASLDASEYSTYLPFSYMREA